MRIGSLKLPHYALVLAYTQHYAGTQVGSGMLPAFEGTMFHDGSGLGDIRRSVFRAVLPIFSYGASTLLRGAVDRLSQGKSLGYAATCALAPTMQDVVGNMLNRVMQKGRGRPRKIHSKRVHTKPCKRSLYKRNANTHKRHSTNTGNCHLRINF